MQKYESIPKTVQAIRFVLPDLAPGEKAPDMFHSWPVKEGPDGFYLALETESGLALCHEGDWIVQRGDNKPYPVGAEEFPTLYREPRAAMAEIKGAAAMTPRPMDTVEFARLMAAGPKVRDDIGIAKAKDLAQSLVPGQYIGTKIIEMLGYAEDNLGHPGLRVRYPDGYESWSPVEAFVGAYQRTSGLPFGLALAGTMKGYRACRAGWNGAGQWVAMSPGSKALPAERFWNPNNRAFAAGQPGGVADVVPCMTMKNAQGEIVMGWAPSQGDLFATDWVLLPPLEAVPQ